MNCSVWRQCRCLDHPLGTRSAAPGHWGWVGVAQRAPGRGWSSKPVAGCSWRRSSPLPEAPSPPCDRCRGTFAPTDKSLQRMDSSADVPIPASTSGCAHRAPTPHTWHGDPADVKSLEFTSLPLCLCLSPPSPP